MLLTHSDRFIPPLSLGVYSKRGTYSVIVIIVGGRLGVSSSNPEQGCLHFIFALILLGKVWIQLFSNLFNLDMATSLEEGKF